MIKYIFTTTVLILAISSVNAQKAARDSTYRQYFIGSTFFMLGNLSSKNKPDFIQLNFGYRLTHKDVFSLEAKTWKYAWPLGIPYGKSFEAPAEKYPGYIRSLGVALAYQRFLWKGAYLAVHAFNARQTYFNDSNEKIQNGYQLFMTYRLGYHIQLFRNRFFVEPSMAVTHRPVDTHMPESFAILDNKWPKYFLFEPGLHFGFKF